MLIHVVLGPLTNNSLSTLSRLLVVHFTVAPVYSLRLLARALLQGKTARTQPPSLCKD
jgi:hypothetical protein